MRAKKKGPCQRSYSPDLTPDYQGGSLSMIPDERSERSG
jgi:hypothetical protein